MGREFAAGNGARAPRLDPAMERQPLAAETIDAEAEQVVAKARRLMLLVLLGTFVAVGAVLAIAGYRLMTSERAPPVEATANLPAGSRVIGTSVAGDRLLVTIEVAGAIEVRSYDARTFQPTGRLRLNPQP